MIRMRVRRSVCVASAALAAMVGFVACSASHDAKASTSKKSSSNGEVAKGAATPTTSTVRPGHPDFLHVDSVKPRLISGRNGHDSTSYFSAIRAGTRAISHWPAWPTPLEGSLLPDHRIVAFYGNPHSKKMGVLGEYPAAQMLPMLDKAVEQWRTADPSTPVIPAIHLVTVVAQGSAGPDGGWRRRESPATIEQAYGWAKDRKGLLFIDIQAGHSTLQTELPLLLKYLERPDVHLGIDPEFYMHYKREGIRPSAKVGQMMASDVNYVIQTLDKLVAEKHLPPKILIVHRFRADMVPDAENIHPTPRVQVVMDMDGWGPPWLKFDSYRDYIVAHPVEFTGFKLFYHNDVRKGDPLLTPFEVLRLLPRPLYIQYQ
jgi:hypothetical protein